jgi:hypothetical protein
MGCSTNSVPSPLGSMSCSIDGKIFTASEVGAVNVFGLVSITGDEKSSGTTVTLGMDSNDAKAGKSIDVGDISGGSFGSSLTAVTIIKNGKETQFAASTGTIIIASASKSEVSGTFNFTATDLTGSNKDIKITNGKFSAKILF